MPLYEWECGCGERETVFAAIADRDAIRPQHDCGKQLKRLVGGNVMLYFEESRGRIQIGLSDKPITSKKQHERMMKAAQVTDCGDYIPKAIRDNPKTLGMKRILEKDSKRRWV